MMNRAALKLLSALSLLVVTACDTDKNDGKNDELVGETEDETETDAATEVPTTGEPTGESTGGEEDSEGTTGAPELPCDAEHYTTNRPCGEGGLQFCTYTDEAVFAWGQCVTSPVCVPEPEEQFDCQGCAVDPAGVPYEFDACGSDESTTPLVLSFDGAAVGYASAGRTFDLGRCAATDWPTSATPWLALDRDGSGAIDGGHELFGSATRLRGGALADNGFAALRELDADGDGRLTAADPGFAALVLWTDDDGDRRSTGLELQPLAAHGLVSIDLAYASDRRCDARGNCEVERAGFTFADELGRTRTGEVVDVHLACQ
ncbi:MAG: hypothetical protein JNL82_09070 [Myxococcales bacterium]|nr:hypothetical protein [Myxococcales bacterium]